MKRILLILIALGFAATVSAQTSPRIYRSEFVPFDTREAADALDRKNIAKYKAFEPKLLTEGEDVLGLGEEVEIPNSWFDSFIYLHLENVRASYTLCINERPVIIVNDTYSPLDLDITPYVKQGENDLLFILHKNPYTSLEKGFSAKPVKPFSNSYLFAQEKRSIRDFNVKLTPDSLYRFGILDLEVILQNGFNYEEPITVGFDIYDPTGKLLEFSVNEITVAGQSVDTLRFHPFIYHTNEHRWGVNGKSPLYKVMLYTKRNGTFKEYIPIKIGFDQQEVKEGQFCRFGKPVNIVWQRYNAAGDEQTTRKELLNLKKNGVNTLWPNYPQPYWFYDLCDAMGMMVIDQANLNAPDNREDRTVGGTPTNDPKLVDEYIDRVRAMYYRSRNHTCIIAFALGGECGNGYNMYKAYQWLKSVAPDATVIYPDADGEWNTDF